MGGGHPVLLAHAVVVDVEDGLSGHGAERAAVYQFSSDLCGVQTCVLN